jgi:RNA polymerase sigma factor (TIGR02999 family)
MTESGEITRLLAESNAGDVAARERLLVVVYQELRRMAHRRLARHRRGTLLDTTVLVHEAYVKLAEHGVLPDDCRAHFFAVAGRAMRQVVTDNARSRSAQKRGGGERPLDLSEHEVAGYSGEEIDVLALEQALERLATRNERLVRVVECRYFAGLDDEETASALGISSRTVQRDWLKARAWLKRELER